MVRIDYPLSKLRQMHAEYMNPANRAEDVAARYYISRQTMMNMFQREGLPKRRADNRTACKTKGWSEQKVKQFYGTYLAKPLPEVARQYGMSTTAVYITLRRYGLRTRKQLREDELDRIAKEI